MEEAADQFEWVPVVRITPDLQSLTASEIISEFRKPRYPLVRALLETVPVDDPDQLLAFMCPSQNWCLLFGKRGGIYVAAHGQAKKLPQKRFFERREFDIRDGAMVLRAWERLSRNYTVIRFSLAQREFLIAVQSAAERNASTATVTDLYAGVITGSIRDWRAVWVLQSGKWTLLPRWESL